MKRNVSPLSIDAHLHNKYIFIVILLREPPLTFAIAARCESPTRPRNVTTDIHLIYDYGTCCVVRKDLIGINGTGTIHYTALLYVRHKDARRSLFETTSFLSRLLSSFTGQYTKN